MKFAPTYILQYHYPPPTMPQLRASLDALGETFKLQGTFLADNLFTFGKTLRFITDKQFSNAFLAAKPDRQDHAMIWRRHVLYWAARRAMKLEGDFVEAGCYEGFTAALLCNALDLRAAGKRFWLYDLFEVPEKDHRLKRHSEELYDQVVARFAGDPVTVIKGGLPGSLAQGEPEKISLLHIDMNNVTAEIGTLDALFDRVVPGGTIVLDDYGWHTYDEQTDAHDAWFATRDHAILELPTGQGVVIKQ